MLPFLSNRATFLEKSTVLENSTVLDEPRQISFKICRDGLCTGSPVISPRARNVFKSFEQTVFQRKRSEGRMKIYPSASELSWSTCTEHQRQHILDVVRQEYLTVLSLGKYIPIEGILEMLITNSKVAITELENRIKDLQRFIKSHGLIYSNSRSKSQIPKTLSLNQSSHIITDIPQMVQSKCGVIVAALKLKDLQTELNKFKIDIYKSGKIEDEKQFNIMTEIQCCMEDQVDGVKRLVDRVEHLTRDISLLRSYVLENIKNLEAQVAKEQATGERIANSAIIEGNQKLVKHLEDLKRQLNEAEIQLDKEQKLRQQTEIEATREKLSERARHKQEIKRLNSDIDSLKKVLDEQKPKVMVSKSAQSLPLLHSEKSVIAIIAENKKLAKKFEDLKREKCSERARYKEEIKELNIELEKLRKSVSRRDQTLPLLPPTKPSLIPILLKKPPTPPPPPVEWLSPAKPRNSLPVISTVANFPSRRFSMSFDLIGTKTENQSKELELLESKNAALETNKNLSAENRKLSEEINILKQESVSKHKEMETLIAQNKNLSDEIKKVLEKLTEEKKMEQEKLDQKVLDLDIRQPPEKDTEQVSELKNLGNNLEMIKRKDALSDINSPSPLVLINFGPPSADAAVQEKRLIKPNMIPTLPKSFQEDMLRRWFRYNDQEQQTSNHHTALKNELCSNCQQAAIEQPECSTCGDGEGKNEKEKAEITEMQKKKISMWINKLRSKYDICTNISRTKNRDTKSIKINVRSPKCTSKSISLTRSDNITSFQRNLPQKIPCFRTELNCVKTDSKRSKPGWIIQKKIFEESSSRLLMDR